MSLDTIESSSTVSVRPNIGAEENWLPWQSPRLRPSSRRRQPLPKRVELLISDERIPFSRRVLYAIMFLGGGRRSGETAAPDAGAHLRRLAPPRLGGGARLAAHG